MTSKGKKETAQTNRIICNKLLNLLDVHYSGNIHHLLWIFCQLYINKFGLTLLHFLIRLGFVGKGFGWDLLARAFCMSGQKCFKVV